MIINDECKNAMSKMESNSIDFIVTDPPYGLHFMGKDWDNFNKSNFDENGKHKHLDNASIDGRTCDFRKIASANSHAGSYDENRNDEFQEFILKVGIEMLRILKPGGHVAMFGAPRRHHRQMSGLEDAGFEIRDCIAWIFGQGFPKSHNFGKKLGGNWSGFGTALKPAYESIIIAMKPLDGTFAHNAEKWGVAGINIDDCRISTKEKWKESGELIGGKSLGKYGDGLNNSGRSESNSLGRWPANLILDEESGQQLDEMTIDKIHSAGKQRTKSVYSNYNATSFDMSSERQMNRFGDEGGASRFFYCAKASSKERNGGLEGMPFKSCGIKNDSGRGFSESDPYKEIKRQNNHPTVKPLSLMKYLITLLAPPGNPICLDPFAGSGSTLVAAKELGIECIGIEMSQEYCEIANKRLEHAKTTEKQLEFNYGS